MPSDVDRTDRLWPLSRLVSLMVDSGRTASDESRTTPPSDAVADWQGDARPLPAYSISEAHAPTTIQAGRHPVVGRLVTGHDTRAQR